MSVEQKNNTNEAAAGLTKPRPAASGPDRLAGWIWTPVVNGERNPVNLVRAFCRVIIIVCQEFVRDKIPLRASALTFTVVLSMVPILALGTAVLKGLGVGGEIRHAAHSFIEQLEVTTGELELNRGLPRADRPDPSDETPVSGMEEDDSLSGHLHRVVDTVFDYVDKTNFATMGLVGILVLLLAIFSVLDSIEQTFNDIWQTRSGRPLRRKLIDYLAMLVLLPLTINFGVAAVAALQSPDLLLTIKVWVPWLGPRVIKLLPVLAVAATFTILYSFLPNTRVTLPAAFTGGIFGALGWFLLQAVYFKLQIVVVRYNAIYGSFAALPLFLLWIYFSWMIFLVGAEISFGVQVWRRYLWNKLTLSPVGRLALAFDILMVAAGDYRHKRLTTRDSLVWALKQPDAYIKELLDLFCRAGLMRYVRGNGDYYIPAAPLPALDLVEVADLVLGWLSPAVADDNPAAEASQALRQRLAGRQLKPRE
jgi:membrane protein